MIVIPRELPFFLTDVEEHALLKEKIISSINSMGIFSYIDAHQSISSTDWHLNQEFPRPYFTFVQPIFEKVCEEITQKMGYEIPLNVSNYWFQKYCKGDSHGWHKHGGANFSNVYYVNLPENSAITTFKVLDKEFSIEVKEGQILSFPGVINHCSKPNSSEEPKLVIAFNC